jgi:hypothetical protein
VSRAARENEIYLAPLFQVVQRGLGQRESRWTFSKALFKSACRIEARKIIDCLTSQECIVA